MATFVLVHGAFHGGWCWYKLVAELQARGHKVVAPDLPGHGKLADREASLPIYGEFVADVIRQQEEKVVLVGHSMGGAVITVAGELVPDRIAQIVYLTAFLSPSGGSMAGDLSSQATVGGRIPVNEAANPLLYGDCMAEDIALANLCLTPQAQRPLTEKIEWTPERWGTIPRTFIGCIDDLAFAIAAQRHQAEAQPGTRWFELKASHSPFLSMPGKLADILEEVAG